MSSKIPKRNANDTQEEMQSNLQAHFSPHFLDKASLQDVKDSQTRLGIGGFDLVVKIVLSVVYRWIAK